jgi:branched-chain amino acid transport system ATP-binding protein
MLLYCNSYYFFRYEDFRLSSETGGAMALLELKGITKYFGGLAAVSDFDMDVSEGEIRGLIGPNGAGKTTCYNLITGVYPLTSGKISYNGEDITGLKPHQIAGKGLVRTFQAIILFMEFTIQQSVMTACHLHAGMNPVKRYLGGAGGEEKENAKKTLEIMDFLGLSDLKDELAMNLPHGHQRALAIAMAMAAEPKMLLLDEPVTGMNPSETQHMMGLIKKLRAERGMTILLVEHDMRAVMGLCDELTVLSLLAEGEPAGIMENEEVIDAYLGKAEIFA